MTISFSAGIGSDADAYDAVLLDLWGVVHNGKAPFPEAMACMRALRAQGRRIVLLSNAPRRADRVAGALAEMGVARQAYDLLLTSGDATHDALAKRDDPWHAALGRVFYHLGPERDWGLLDDLDYRRVYDLAEADFILDTGFFDDETETPEDYRDRLENGLKAGLPMVCANPDLNVFRGERRIPCAGALAALYEDLGGDVRYHGKPHPRIYGMVAAALGDPAPERVLMVGDSLRTDIAGAKSAGFRSVFVASGIHQDELHHPDGSLDRDACTGLITAQGVYPDAVMDRLRW